MALEPVDRVEILVLVDNATDMLSSTPSHVESEAAGLMRRGIRMMAGKCLCCAAHGLSCLVTAYRGATTHTVLFDTGPEEYSFERNVTRLGADLGVVESIVLSHGHWDHAGAMLLALSMMRSRNGGRKIPYYAHPGMFHSRGVKLPNGTVRRMEDIPSVEDLTAFGAEVIVSWEPDELLMDERFLAVNVAGKGLIIFSACSHAGIVNVLTHARDRFPGVPLHAAMGGLHLSGPNEAIIPQTVEGLRAFGLKTIAAGHCTGWRGMTALANAFGDKILAPTAVGKRYTF